MKQAFTHRREYSSANVTTAAWAEISAALEHDLLVLEVFDSSGQTLKLGIGASGSEVDADIQIVPGGNSPFKIECLLNKGLRLSIRAVSANATTGELLINGYTK